MVKSPKVTSSNENYFIFLHNQKQTSLNMDNIKKKTRLQIKQMKAHFTQIELDEMSLQIISLIKIHPWFIKAKTICLYNSLPDEVNTQNLIKELSNSDKKILLPSINASNVMELHEYSEGIDEIKIGAYGIKESQGKVLTDYSAIDLIIVPGVAFDINNNRLGRGKGYYDQFLRMTQAKKMGICFPFQMLKEIPTENHDIKMDAIITIDNLRQTSESSVSN